MTGETSPEATPDHRLVEERQPGLHAAGVEGEPALGGQADRHQVGVAEATAVRGHRGGARDGVRELTDGEMAVHLAQVDVAALGGVLTELVEQPLGPGRPAGAHGRLAGGRVQHRQLAGTAGGGPGVSGVEMQPVGALQGVGGVVATVEELGGGGHRDQVVGAQGDGIEARPAVERGAPVAALVGLPSAVQVLQDAHRDPPSPTDDTAWTPACQATGTAAGRAARSTIRSATNSASRPTPGQHHRAERVLEAQPAEEQAGQVLDHAAHLDRPPVRADQRGVDPVEDLPEARRPHHGRHVERPVADHRPAVADAGDPIGEAHHPAGGEVVALDAQHRATVGADLLHLLAPHRGAAGQHVPPDHEDDGEEHPQQPGVPAHGDLAAVAAGQGGGVGLRELVGDVGARVRGADDQHRTVAELARAAVLARVQLEDPGVELARERGDQRRAAEGAGGDHDVVAGVGPPGRIRRGDGEATVRSRRQVRDADAEPHRQAVVGGVLLEVVGDVVLAREGPAGRGERQARQAVVLGGGVEPEGVVLAAPLVADARAAVEDDERAAASLQVVAGGQAGLAGADDDGLECGWCPCSGRYEQEGRGRVGRTTHPRRRPDG